MRNAIISKSTIFENSGCVLLARVVGLDGAPVQEADIDSITVKVYSGSTLVNTPSVTVADAIFDTLQVDERWDEDDVGFNCAVVLGGDNFPSPNTVYRVEIRMEPATGGDPFYLVYQIRTISIQSE